MLNEIKEFEGERIIMIKVLIVDDMIILRECLRMAISQDSDLTVVGCAGDGKEAVEMSKELQPDVILMDLNMPVYSGYDAIIDIKKGNPYIKILVLSVEGDEKNIASAFRNGADGYVLKDIAPDDLFVVMKKAFAGEKYVHDYAFYMGKEMVKIKNNSLESYIYIKLEFTDREKDVLELVIQGMTNVEIAEHLGISAGRARNIVTELISKYMVKNRTQLAVMAVKMNMLDEGDAIIEFDISANK